MQTVLGTILDPAADKALMTTLTVSLAYKGMLPSMSYRLRAPLTAEFDRKITSAFGSPHPRARRPFESLSFLLSIYLLARTSMMESPFCRLVIVY